MKVLAMIFMSFIAATAKAADPHWLSGITDEKYRIEIWRSESCGCCKAWIEHLQAHSFTVVDRIVDDLNAVKDQYAIPATMRSCHTAKVGDLLVEGHVPATDIKAALNNENISVLAVPGMPSGSPGMDFPGARKDDFHVVAVEGGAVTVFSRHHGY